MRRIIASAVIAGFVFTTASPILAQRSTKKVGVARPIITAPLPASVSSSAGTFADFGSVTAATDGNGVIIRWAMRRESGVATYQVYRTDAKGGRTAVGQPVLGSAAKTRAPFLYGEEYSAFDPDGTSNSSYEIQALNISGSGTVSTGPFGATFQRAALAAIEDARYSAAESGTASSVQRSTPVGGDTNAAVTADPNTQKWVAAQPGAKIAVKREGLYRVTRAELAAAAFNLVSNSANWRLFTDGVEQPILVGAGDQYIEFYGKGIDTPETDTRFYYLIADSTPGIRMSTRTLRSSGSTASTGSSRIRVEKKERSAYTPTIFNGNGGNKFFGGVINSAGYTHKITLTNVDTASTDDVTLALQIQGFSSTGHDIAVTINGHSLTSLGDVTGSFASPMAKVYTFPSSYLVEGSNSILLAATTAGDTSLFDTSSVIYSQQFKASQNRATVFIPGRRKIGLTGFGAPNSSVVTIQNATVAEPAASSALPTNVASSTPGVLRLSALTYTAGTGGTGIARVTVTRVFGSTGSVGATLSLANGTATGGSSCGSGVDYIFPASSTVTLADGIVAKDIDIQLCSGNIADPNGETFSATLSAPTGGAVLASSNIRAFDITYGVPQAVAGLQTLVNGTDLGVIVPAYRAAVIYAMDDSYALQAASVAANVPSTLSAANNSADFLIISHPSLMSAAQDWATYRQSATGGGFSTKVIDVNDIYDEFSYGVQSSAAVRSFLNYAYNSWQTKPKYILMMGDSTYDPRNFEARANPLYRLPTQMVDLIYGESASDEALADFDNNGVAEIPIGRIPVIDSATAEIVLAKTIKQELAPTLSFARGGVFVSDAPIDYTFTDFSLMISNNVPTMPKTYISRGDASNNEFPTSLGQVVTALSAGPYIVNYSGHGASGIWGSSSWFSGLTVPQLTNTDPTIYTMLTCLNGYFIRTNFDSLSESLLKSPNGASLVWASTTETTPDIQNVMGNRFYSQLNAGTIQRVGDLITDAKQVTPPGDVRYSWALIGDPATKVRP